MLLHMAMLQHVLKAVQGDALGHPGSRKHGTVAIKFDAGQDGCRLAAACTWQLSYHLHANKHSIRSDGKWAKGGRGYTHQDSMPECSCHVLTCRCHLPTLVPLSSELMSTRCWAGTSF